jgi:hypothetical protein
MKTSETRNSERSNETGPTEDLLAAPADQPDRGPDETLDPARPDRDSEMAVRALYARLAREYEEKEPIVRDHGGGLPGDRYPF